MLSVSNSPDLPQKILLRDYNVYHALELAWYAVWLLGMVFYFALATGGWPFKVGHQRLWEGSPPNTSFVDQRYTWPWWLLILPGFVALVPVVGLLGLAVFPTRITREIVRILAVIGAVICVLDGLALLLLFFFTCNSNSWPSRSNLCNDPINWCCEFFGSHDIFCPNTVACAATVQLSMHARYIAVLVCCVLFFLANLVTVAVSRSADRHAFSAPPVQ